MPASPISTAYVFADLPKGRRLLAGELVISRTLGTFSYSDEWLAAADAYPLDPVNLPLSHTRYTNRSRSRLFGVFSDAGPDDWGTKVMLLGRSRLPANELERLLACSGYGAGCLKFSLSRSRPKEVSPLPGMEMLEQLEQASWNLAEEKAIPEELFTILMPGTSMGGARPKVSIQEGEKVWLAKFSLPQDPINVPCTEYATLKLAAAAGISAPPTRLINLGTHQVYLIERFDRDPGQPIHFISARSLYNLDRIKHYANAERDPYSYPALARILRAHSMHGLDDCRQLYRRLIFNVLIGNTDDHAQNHAMIYRTADQTWQLSPAYDLLPILSGGQEQALGIGRQGRESTISNALTLSQAFGVQPDEAKDIVRQQLRLMSNWQQHYSESGVPANTLRILQKLIEPRLQKAASQLSGAGL